LELGFVEVEGVVGDGDGGAVEGGEEDEDFAEVAGGEAVSGDGRGEGMAWQGMGLGPDGSDVGGEGKGEVIPV